MDQTKNSRKVAPCSASYRLTRYLCVFLLIVLIFTLATYMTNDQLKRTLEINGMKAVTADHYLMTNLVVYGRLLFAVVVSLGIAYLYRMFPFQREKLEKAEQKRSDAWLHALRIWCANAETLSKLDTIAIEKFVDEGLRPYDEAHKKELLGILLDLKESAAMPQQPKKVCLTYEGDLKAISNKENPRYRAELQAAVDLWLSFEADPLPAGCSPKSEITARLVDWQNDNHETFLDTPRDRITKMVNWDKDGNKQKPKF